MATITTLAAGEICCDAAFDARDGADLERHHVRTLAAILGNGSSLDALLVWRNPSNGTYTLLDGRHRLAAYQSTRKTEAIPVRVFEGSGMEAMETAARANSTTKLPLTPTQRKNLAWKLVWCWEDQLSISRTARAAGVSPRFVSIMRARARLMKPHGGKFTGSWFLDSRDTELTKTPHEEMTERQRKKIVKETSEAFRKAAGMLPKLDRELFADVLHTAFGRYHREAAEWLYADEWGALWGNIVEGQRVPAEVAPDAEF